MMGNIDDEFEKMVQGLSDIDKDVGDESESEFQTFSSLYLVESLGHLSRTLAFLIEFMEVSMEHVARGTDEARPALTKDQVAILQEVFQAAHSFNETVMHPPGDDSDDSGII